MRIPPRRRFSAKAAVVSGLRRYFEHFGRAPYSRAAYSHDPSGRRSDPPTPFRLPAPCFGFSPPSTTRGRLQNLTAALKHCQCGAVLVDPRSRCCGDCAARRRSAALKRGPGNHKYPATAAIDAEIRAIYSECNLREKTARISKLAASLEYPRWAIKKRAQQLGLTRPKEIRYGRRRSFRCLNGTASSGPTPSPEPTGNGIQVACSQIVKAQVRIELLAGERYAFGVGPSRWIDIPKAS